MKRILITAVVWLVLLGSAMAGELRILHTMRYADPTGANPNPWLFSRELGDSAGGVFCQALFHGQIFSKPGVVDVKKLAKKAASLQPGPVMLNVEGRENRCFDDDLELIPENVERRIAIVQCVRQYGPPGLEIGFFGALPPQQPWLVTGYGMAVGNREARRNSWGRLVEELKPLARHVDCCFTPVYPPRDWSPEVVLWHIRRTVRAVNDVYHLSAYPTFFVSGWYGPGGWGEVPNEALAQMENRIPGDVFESWLEESQRQGAAGVLLFGGRATDGTHIKWDEEAAWWQVVRKWASQ